MSWAFDVAAVLLLLALVISLLRLSLGPTLADRVVALDLIAVITVGLILVDAVRSDQVPYLRPALLLGLVGFLATVAFAYHLKRRGHQPDREDDA